MSKVILSPKKPSFNLKLGSGFILLFALIYFFDGSGLFSALVPAILVHECGHMLALLLCGAYPLRLNATLSGFALDYAGDLSQTQELLSALAGPVTGLVFAFACAKLGAMLESDYLLMCAGLGLILNLFNLLPVKPLDGGRIANFALIRLFGANIARKLIRAIGLVTTALLIACGFYCILRGLGPALFAAGIWLLVLQLRKSCKYP